jgi:hypothetical protein
VIAVTIKVRDVSHEFFGYLKMKKLAGILLILIVFFASFKGVFANAGINRKINFQGKVVNKGVGATDGTNVTDGNYNFTFTIWNAPSTGTSLWTETWNSGTTQVSVSSGIFTVALGTQVTFPATMDFNADSLYLGVNFSGDGEMTPRIQMTAVPYAFNAEKVGGLTVTSTTGTLTVANGKTISFGDNFTMAAGVGITLNQSLATTDSPNFAGLSIGGTAITSTAKEINYLHNLAVGNTGALFYANGVGITQLNIGTSGYFLMSQGTNPVWVANTAVGTSYATTNGLSAIAANTFGLGGTLSQNTQIGTSGYSLSFLGLGNSQSLFIGTSGYVGIGTTNPSQLLDINGIVRINNGTVYTNDSLAVGAGFRVTRLNGIPFLNYEREGTGASGNQIGSFGAVALNSGSARTVFSQINFYSNNYTSGTETGEIRFKNAINGNLTDILNIVGTNVGIGTTNPVKKLDVAGDLNLSGTIFVGSGGTGIGVSGSSGQILSSTSTGLAWITAGGAYTATNGLNLNASAFGLGGTLTQNTQIGTSGYGLLFLGSGNTQSLFIGATGYVGIGTTNPGTNLEVHDVAGNSQLTISTDAAAGKSPILALTGDEDGTPTNARIGLETGAGVLKLVYGSPFAASINGLVINSSGNVGIGTTNNLNAQLTIAKDLSVGTSAYITGNFSIGGTFVSVGSTNIVGSLNASYLGGLASSAFLQTGYTGFFNTAINGLQKIGSTGIGLGGTLTQNTQIGMSGYTLAFLGLGNSLGLSVGQSGFVGIGTSNPSKKLDVTGDINLTGTIFAAGASGSSGKILSSTGTGLAWITDGGVGTTYATTNGLSAVVTNTFGLGGTLSQNTSIGTSGYTLLFLGVGNTQSLFIGATGYVGIGTTNPSKKLDVTGDINLTGTIFAAGASGSSGKILSSTGTGLAWITAVGGSGSSATATNGLSLISGSVGLGGTLTQNTTIGTSSFSWSVLGLGNSQSLFINSDGNVGIGTTEPGALLDLAAVSPNLRLTSSGTSLYASFDRNYSGNVLSFTNQVNRPSGGYSPGIYTAVSRHITVTNGYSDAISGQAAFSVEMWVKPVTLAGSQIFWSDDATSGRWGGLFGGTSVLFSVDSTSFTVPSTALTAGEWNHIVFVQESSTNGRIYVNGVSQGTGSIGANSSASNDDFIIGSYGSNQGYGFGSDSSFDEVRVYQKALSGTEVANHYNSGIGVHGSPETGLAFGLHLDENSGTSLADYSGNNYVANLSSLGDSWVTGIVPNPPTTYLATVLTSVDGLAGNEGGIVTIGDAAGGLIMQGITQKFMIGAVEAMRLDTNGNLGIGTSSPSKMLDVAGDINLTGTIFASGATGSSGQVLSSTGTGLAWIAAGGVGTTYAAGVGLTLSNTKIFSLNLGNTNVWLAPQYFSNGIGVTGNSTFQNNLTIGGTFVSVGSTNIVGSLNASYLGGLASSAFLQTGYTGFFNTAVNGLQKIGSTGVGLGGTLTQANYTSLNLGAGSSGFLIMGLNNNTQPFSIRANGNVGVGTTSSPYLFSVQGTQTSGIAFFKNTYSTSSTAPVVVIQTGIATTGATGGGEYLRFLNSSGVSIGRIRVGSTASTVAYSTSAAADFAEYVIASEPTEAGDLIAFSNNKYIKASAGDSLAGIHSSSPSFIGNEGISEQPNALPLAMSGIVKLKVSSINGSISPGDPLTASLIRGVAVKAVGPGYIGAKAIGSYSNSDPNQVGIIDVIINLGWYQPGLGISEQTNFASVQFNYQTALNGLTMAVNELKTSKISPLIDKNGNPVQLVIDNNVQITGKLSVGLLRADKISANSIDGLDIITQRIDNLEKKVDELGGQVAGLATSSAIISITPTPTPILAGNTIIKDVMEFWNKVLFKEEVVFEKTPIFNNQMGGLAVINAGETGVEVKFDQSLAQTPVVNVTMAVESGKEQSVLDQNYVYLITNKSVNGFTIVLNKTAVDNVEFSWTALSVKEARTYQNEIIKVTPTVTVIPTVTEEIATPSAEATGGAKINE